MSPFRMCCLLCYRVNWPHIYLTGFEVQALDIVLIFSHILVHQEYWVLTESRIPLKPVLGGGRIVALSV